MQLNEAALQRVMPLRIIIPAMIVGVIGFAVVAGALGGSMVSAAEQAQMFLVILACMAVMEVIGYSVVRMVHLAQTRREIESARIDAGPGDPSSAAQLVAASSYFTLTLIAAAMAEGIGLFGTVVFLITGAKPALAALGLALVVLVLQIPTRGKLADFVASATGEPCE